MSKATIEPLQYGGWRLELGRFAAELHKRLETSQSWICNIRRVDNDEIVLKFVSPDLSTGLEGAYRFLKPREDLRSNGEIQNV